MPNLSLKRSLIILLLFLFVCPFSSVYSEILTTPVNNESLDLDEKPEGYVFLLVGHIYGAQNKSVYPSSSLLSNIQMLNNQSPKFMVLLGDSVYLPERLHFEALKESLLSKLNFPVFSTPGNHDGSSGSLYKEFFGKTYFGFQYRNSSFVFLDSEMDNGNISGKQLHFLLEKIEQCRTLDQIRNIFIFSHRLIWALDNEPYREIIPLVNGSSYHPRIESNITKIVLPKLKSLKEKNVFMISGDVGLGRSLPLFYDDDEDSNMTYIATGIGDTAEDFILKATVRYPGKVAFTLIPLCRQPGQSVESFGLDYWQNQIKQLDKARLRKTASLISKIRRLFMMKRFWYGVVFSIMGYCLFLCARRIRSC